MVRDRYFDLVEGVHRMANPGPRIPRTLVEAYQDVVDGLRRANVRFVLHGAFALAAYGYERATGDVDFLIPADPRAVRAVYAAMGDLKAVPAPPGPENAEDAIRAGSDHVTFNLSGWLMDFFFDPGFAKVLARSERRRFGGRMVRVIAARNLAERKSERGTLQDLADLERLREVERSARPRPGGRGRRTRRGARR